MLDYKGADYTSYSSGGGEGIGKNYGRYLSGEGSNLLPKEFICHGDGDGQGSLKGLGSGCGSSLGYEEFSDKNVNTL
jgi:hypothetical protein